MNCPNCTIEMVDEARHGVMFSTCGHCGGNFVLRDALLTAAGDNRDARTLGRLLDTARPQDDQGSACPKADGGTLQKLEIHGVEIERCSACRGIYFDRGELRILVEGKPELPKVPWPESPRLDARGVAAVTLGPDVVLGALARLFV